MQSVLTEHAETRAGAGVVDVVTFNIGAHRFALRASVVREIVRVVAISPLPGAPSVVEGVINFRGRLVPVLDLRARFGYPHAPLALDQHLLVILAGERLLSLRVDRAHEILALPEDIIARASAVTFNAPYVEGVACLPDGLLVIQDVERFLSVDEGRRTDDALKTRGDPVPG